MFKFHWTNDGKCRQYCIDFFGSVPGVRIRFLKEILAQYVFWIYIYISLQICTEIKNK
ncbi:hypothetical protein Phi13:2_gp023 [Cellulophaga phage phi13:2]|uniref:Uncharacterized protein n=1 Tax=Cellulophaga phage phi13:2 TaxID=1328030 RepID=S0A5P1_9CAUD|nr:hypothetical protein Phi13:2_gp023 [Cellulophaga phage phi13:2]AGO49633.1 hypothetical protein Phi13:2_gp023 [Cellulophaga phage phi13:2]